MPSIDTLLVANRGEIARRIVRTARALAITTVAVFSDPDRDAPFVAEADTAIHLPGALPADTYLNVDALIAAARAGGATAVHPGYGFLSERADFARACDEAGFVFVGPPASVIEAMGSKLEAKRIMAEAGVPVLDGVPLDDHPSGPPRVALGERVGFPLLVKAAHGGGGRGMRVVRDPAELDAAIDAAQREAAAAFGDGTVFLERYIEAPRHVEVQIFGDAHGNVVHLFERECSIQRRHQKLIEETPSPALSPARRHDLCAAAVAAGKAIGYTNAGTVEFVLDPEGRFWFLEVNTRLQVEHPVTELVTGLDLVALQLDVAAGHPLPPAATRATVTGHAIEARLYAEDVPAGYLPTSGTFHRLRVPEWDGVRVDAGYVDGSTVTPFYDAMLAKVIAWGATRDEARRRLARALESAELDGPVTNRALLVETLRTDDFAAGRTDTAFLERHDPVRLGAEPHDETTVEASAVAAALAARARRQATSPLPAGIPASWRSVGRADQPLALTDGDQLVTVTCWVVRDRLVVAVNGEKRDDLKLWSATPDHVDVEMVSVRRRFRVDATPDAVYVQSELGRVRFVETERFPLPVVAADPGSLRAPLPGRVVAVWVHAGDRVGRGQPLVALEAMKMEHTLDAPYDGTVTDVRVGVDHQVELGEVLLVVEPEGGAPDA
jgi:propionyl-CoA carboxylase alpha chain